jgi:hypothetical protein
VIKIRENAKIILGIILLLAVATIINAILTPTDTTNAIPINNIQMVNNSSDEFPGDYYLTYTITPDKNYSDLYIEIYLYSDNGTNIGWGTMDVTNVTGVTNVTQSVGVYYKNDGEKTEKALDFENSNSGYFSADGASFMNEHSPAFDAGWYENKTYDQSEYPVPASAHIYIYDNSTGQYEEAYESNTTIDWISNSTVSLSL